MEGYHIRVLGTFQCMYGGRPLPKCPKGRLLSLWIQLLFQMDEPLSRKHIAFRLWPDSTEEQALTNLRKQIHGLKKSLPESEDFLEIQPEYITWKSNDRCYFDVLEFERLANGQRQSELEEAVIVYLGPLLLGEDSDFILESRESLSLLYQNTLSKLVFAAEQRRKFDVALKYSYMLLREDQLSEENHIRIARLQVLKGDMAAARQQLAKMEAVLRQELDIAPSASSKELLAYISHLQEEQIKTPNDVPFVGREHEWEQLMAGRNQAVEDGSMLVVLQGEAGIGKTRLAEHFTLWARSKGIRALSAHCYASSQGGRPYEPFVKLLKESDLTGLDKESLVELSRIVANVRAQHPDLALPLPLNNSSQLHTFYQALAKGLFWNTPSILFLDDIQWADQESLQMMENFLRSDSLKGLLILATLRTGEGASPPHVERFLETMITRHKCLSIAIEPFCESESYALVSQFAEQYSISRPTLNLEQVYHDSGGNPLMIHEIVRSMSTGVIIKDYDATVLALMITRLRYLPAEHQRLVDMLAVFGKASPLSFLLELSESSYDMTLQQVEDLVARRFLRRTEGGEYDFYHDRMREAAMYRLSDPRKSSLHGLVVRAMMKQEGRQSFGPSEIAHHLEKSGFMNEAVPYYMLAVQTAEDVYAHEKVIQYALKVINADTGPLRLRALSRVAIAYRMMGHWKEAERSYREWLHFCGRAASAVERAGHQMELGNCLRLQGRYEDAMTHLQTAFRMFELLDDRKGMADTHGNLGIVHQYLGHRKEAEYHLQEYIDLNPDSRETEKFTGIVGTLYYEQGQYEQAETFFKMQVRLAHEHGNRAALAKALSGISLTYIEMGRFTAAFATVVERLEVSKTIGDRMGVATAIGLWGRALVKAGYLEEAVRFILSALHEAVDMEDIRFMAMNLGLLGQLWDEQGRDELSLWALQMSEQLSSRLGVKFFECDAIYYKACYYTRRQQWRDAMEIADRGLNMAHKLNRPTMICGLGVTSVQCQAALELISVNDAREQLLSLDLQNNPVDHALIHLALWEIAAATSSRDIAIEVVSKLYHESPVPRHLSWAKRLGVSLDDPPILSPLWPEVILDCRKSFESIRRAIEAMATIKLKA